MASSGSFSTNAYAASEGSRYLVFSWSETSQSIENNKTTISWSLKGGGTTKEFYVYAGNFKVVIAGQTVYSYTGDRIKLYYGTTVASGTYTFTHNDDGTKSFTASAEGGLYNYAVNCTGSKTFTLDAIARASQPSCITYPQHTDNIGFFGDTISIHMNRKSSAFTHVVRYEFGSMSGTCIDAETGKSATAVGTGFKWKIPENFMTLLPSSLWGSGRIYVDTYNGSTKVGTKYCGFTAKVHDRYIPGISWTLEDVTTAGDIYGKPVKGLSKIKVTISATPSYGSPIVSYTVAANGKVYSGATITTDVLTTYGDSPITATIIDKRGRLNSISYTMDVLNYGSPSVSSVTASRCNEDGTANKRGSFVKATFSADVWSMSNKNTAAYTLKYKMTSAASYTPVLFSELNNNYAPRGITYIFPADVGKSYDVVVEAKDRHKTISKSTKAPTAGAIFSWRGFKKSTGIEDGAGIGKIPEKPNTLQVGWDAEFDKEVTYKGKKLLDFFYPVNSIYISYSHTNPGTLFGGTWQRLSNTFLWGSDEKGTIGQTGGEKTHQLTINELPSHSHGAVYSGNVAGTKSYAWFSTTAGTSMGYEAIKQGGDAAHNNMPPYTQVSIWRRTA